MLGLLVFALIIAILFLLTERAGYNSMTIGLRSIVRNLREENTKQAEEIKELHKKLMKEYSK